MERTTTTPAVSVLQKWKCPIENIIALLTANHEELKERVGSIFGEMAMTVYQSFH